MRYTYKILSFSLLIVIIVVMMGATWAEKMTGSATFIYGSWWFASLWTVLSVSALLYVFHRQMQRRPVLLLLHLSFAVILAGALVTHIWGKQGSVHLRQGLPERKYVLSDQHTAMLPFSLTLEDFEVLYYSDMKRPKDFVSEVKAGNEMLTISMNHIGRVGGYRLYQSSYDSDLRGSILAVSYDPWGIGITYVGYAMLFLSMLLLLVLPKEGFRATLSQLSPAQQQTSRKVMWGVGTIVVLAVLSYMLYRWCMRSYSDGYLPPVLRSPLLTVHVSVIMIAYVLLFVLFVIGLVGLCIQSEAKTKLLQLVERMLLFPALFCLIAGIFIGAIWANLSWGRYWGWDPKEVWALITMLVYCFAMHTQSLPLFRKPRFYHLFMVLSFLMVLMTYFGVNFLLGGMHSYAT